VEVDTELGHVRVVKYLAAHDSGRIINPLTCTSQVKGGSTMGIGMALHEELLYDPTHGVPLNSGYYGARVMTHLDTPEIEVLFVETDDQYGPFGAKSIGESSIIPSVGAVANAIFQCHREAHQRSSDYSREASGGAGMRAFSNANPKNIRDAVSMLEPDASARPQRVYRGRRKRSAGDGEGAPGCSRTCW
jgi:hypothetical protein